MTRIQLGEILDNKIEIDFKDVQRVYFLIEKLNHLFHQPMYFEDKDIVRKFAEENYPEIRDLYYETLRDIVPISNHDDTIPE